MSLCLFTKLVVLSVVVKRTKYSMIISLYDLFNMD